MKKKYQHTKAVQFLTNQALPSVDELDAMNPAELAAFLSSQGVDLGKLQGEISQLKTQLSGKLALRQAREQRLSKSACSCELDLSGMSQDEFIAALIEKFGRLESIPFAARNFETMVREDWESLYRDHIKPSKM